MKYVVVTRHKALVNYLKELNINCDNIIAHASLSDIQNKNVIGVLPLNLACECKRFIEVSLQVPENFRGKELTLEEIKACNPTLTEYKIKKIKNNII